MSDQNKELNLEEEIAYLKTISIPFAAPKDFDPRILEFLKALQEDRVYYNKQPELTVTFCAMPESNGKQNWTANLRRKLPPPDMDKRCIFHLLSGITIARGEFTHRVRYEADRMRFLIGETDVDPFILDYDADAKLKADEYTEPPLTKDV